ncbi:HAMP domain-containing sensor histidine kinase [Sphingomonas sp. TZW2008]|uniref:PAS domain-containing sensor histidine kinase n=1 Tax=Sphingomonas sp. TZW2008 TaxID=1917973 RepID=UPI000A26BC99|nr:HAMP domain-containing sensor histidine kinase [Sphingomonas sp. TZW2008]
MNGSNAIADPGDWFDGAPCGLLRTDVEGCIVEANAIFALWTGYNREVLVGQSLPDILPISGKIFYETHFVPMLRLQAHFDEVALDFVRADGTRMPALVNAVELRDRDGRPQEVRLAIFRSTDRRRYERDLLDARARAEESARAERATSKLREEFIAVLGHDLRNPLASIASGMRLLAKEPLSDRGRRVTNLIDGSILRAGGLIDNVLDFARGRLGGGIVLSRDADAPLEPVLRQVVDELRAISPDREITANFAFNRSVDCDRQRLGQLLSNLLGNALSHGSKDMPVRIEASIADDVLTISVTNGGAAIPPETMAHLFEPFVRGRVRSDRDGLGLGLHIAAEIAKAHAGKLEVTSDETRTCFSFTMPLNRSVNAGVPHSE